jgi:hypothetical protein
VLTSAFAWMLVVVSAAAIMMMIMNNLDPAVAQFPHELITYGGNGSVFQNWFVVIPHRHHTAPFRLRASASEAHFIFDLTRQGSVQPGDEVPLGNDRGADVGDVLRPPAWVYAPPPSARAREG